MTIVPALANAGAHVTMLQRSPTYALYSLHVCPNPCCFSVCCSSYVLCRPNTDPFANFLGWLLPAKLAYAPPPPPRWHTLHSHLSLLPQILDRSLEERLPAAGNQPNFNRNPVLFQPQKLRIMCARADVAAAVLLDVPQIPRRYEAPHGASIIFSIRLFLF
jgi:hypothetical protein